VGGTHAREQVRGSVCGTGAIHGRRLQLYLETRRRGGAARNANGAYATARPSRACASSHRWKWERFMARLSWD